jgi:uncharacterized protein (DUF427 family)
LEFFKGHIRIIQNGLILADSNKAYRILETSHPPAYYIPLSDVKMDYFEKNGHSSFCEWKGRAGYVDLRIDQQKIRNVGWFYENPSKRYPRLKETISFYASKLDECYVNDEKVKAQEGDFYGGWITSNIKGPFKGGPGTFGW